MPIDYLVTYEAISWFPDEFAEHALNIAATNIALLVGIYGRSDYSRGGWSYAI